MTTPSRSAAPKRQESRGEVAAQRGIVSCLCAAALCSCATPPEPACSFAAQHGFESFAIERPDARIYTEVCGDGPPLVLVHGGADHRIFHPVLRQLGDTCTLVFWDQRGYGATVVARGAAPTRLATDVADLDAIREHFGWEEIDLLAYSHGGPVAIEYGLAHPERVGKLILLATYADDEARVPLAQEMVRAVLDDPERLRQLARLEELELDEDEREVREFLVAPHAFHEKRIPRAAVEFWLSNGCIDSGDPRQRSPRDRGLLEELHRLPHETLVLCGERDRITPLAHSRDVAARLPGGRLEVVPGSGHLLHVEESEAFLAAVRRFLGSGAPPAAR